MERKLASADILQAGGPRVRFAWLSELDDCEDLGQALGGDACIWGYTGAEWARMSTWQKFDGEGKMEPDHQKIQLHQFVAAVHDGEPPEGKEIFLFSEATFAMLPERFSPHLIGAIVAIADELSGWNTDRDPFGKRRRAAAKHSSAGGASPGSGGDSTS